MEQWHPQPAEMQHDEAQEQSASAALNTQEDHATRFGETETTPNEENELTLTATADSIADSERPLHENPRIAALMQAAQDANRRLNYALRDLDQREASSAFQKAIALRKAGYLVKRLHNPEDNDYITLKYRLPKDTTWRECTVMGWNNDAPSDGNIVHPYILDRSQEEWRDDGGNLIVFGNILKDVELDAEDDAWTIISYMVDPISEGAGIAL